MSLRARSYFSVIINLRVVLKVYSYNHFTTMTYWNTVLQSERGTSTVHTAKSHTQRRYVKFLEKYFCRSARSLRITLNLVAVWILLPLWAQPGREEVRLATMSVVDLLPLSPYCILTYMRLYGSGTQTLRLVSMRYLNLTLTLHILCIICT